MDTHDIMVWIMGVLGVLVVLGLLIPPRRYKVVYKSGSISGPMYLWQVHRLQQLDSGIIHKVLYLENEVDGA